MPEVKEFRPYTLKVAAVHEFDCAKCGKHARRRRLFCRRVTAAASDTSSQHTEAVLLPQLKRMAEEWKPTLHRWCALRMPVPK